MGGVHDKTWQFHGPFGDVELELRSDAVDPKTREVSRRELGWLLYDFKYRDPEARRVVLEIYAELHGLLRHQVAQSPEFAFGFGSPGAEALADELLWAAKSGRLIARKRKLSSIVVVRRVAEMPVLGPEPTEEAPTVSKSWVGLVLLDQDGTPVSGRPYRVVTSGGAVYDGQLDSHGTALLKDLEPGRCQISCPYADPHPERTHVVQQGEHLSGIAASYGFDDYMIVWNRPENADLRSQRLDPHVLQSGDAVFIPERKDSPVSKATGTKHAFVIRRSPLKLRLKLLDVDGTAIAGAEVTVADAALTTDGSGIVEASVAKGAQDVAMATLSDKLDLDLGALNPSDDDADAGWKARLFNLGFLWDPTAEEGDEDMAVALQDVQAQYGLPMSGKLDDATKAHLEKVYGA